MSASQSSASQVRAGPVAVRYATALFQLAREQGQLDAVARDITSLAGLIEREADSGWIFDARVAAKEKRERIERLASGFAPLTANFLRLVADKRRLDLLRELPLAFKRCLLADKGAVEGRVDSARPMGSGELAELSVSLGKLLGKQVTLEAQVDPELIAGVRVMVDNKMLDVSAQGRMEELRNKLNSARLN